MMIQAMAMGSASIRTQPQPWWMHCGAHCGSMLSERDGQIWSHEPWHMIRVGQKAPMPIMICMRECWRCRPDLQALKKQEHCSKEAKWKKNTMSTSSAVWMAHFIRDTQRILRDA